VSPDTLLRWHRRLVKAASHVGRHGPRDATLIRLMYRHGLRVSESVALRWDQIDLKQGLLHVNRAKNGVVLRIYSIPVALTG
jgi:integrase